MKILRTIDAELKESCPRIVYIEQLSKQAGASSNLTKCLSNLVKFEVEIYFVCQHSFTVVKETRITIKVTTQWVKYIVPVIAVVGQSHALLCHFSRLFQLKKNIES